MVTSPAVSVVFVVWCTGQPGVDAKPLQKISAPVEYESLMILATTKQGVSAIVFRDEIDTKTDKGVKYDYR